MPLSADMRGRFSVDEGLHHRAQQRSHQVTAIGAAQRLGQLEQGRLVQGHSCDLRFYEPLGRLSQSLTEFVKVAEASGSYAAG